MRMFNSKKGVSEVVANVLIVLLVIVGIAVIWSVVKPTIDKGAKGVQADCFTVALEPVSCTAAGSVEGNYNVVVKRNPGAGNFEEVHLLFEEGTSSERFEPVTPNVVSSTTLAELETATIAATGITLTNPTVNVVVTSGGQLCQITTQPINCA
jgi:FlaG/FlaF family flagellin (archaellin)